MHLICAGFAHGDEWDVVAKHVKLVSPDSFKSLPAIIRNELKSIDCSIPQPGYDGLDYGGGVWSLSNVISGHFAQKEQRDWAVICAQHEKLSLSIFWGGKKQCGALTKDLGVYRSWVTTVKNPGDKEPKGSFDLIIRTLRPPFHPPYDHIDGGEKHDGLEIYFFGKASTVYYCNDGKWNELSGLD